ncbi:MAG: Pterin-binding protein [Dehalococcoidia bacterium]|nr:Pterin-binding protein [Dehalococcoidia bacterium]
MIVIGESIHVISPRVKAALEGRDSKTLQNLAVSQVENGADVLDLNIGPQRREGHQIMPWLVDAIQDVVDVPLCLDTTNAAAMEAGLKRCKRPPIINSTDATETRMSTMMPLAARYNASLIALALGSTGLPNTAEARLEIVMASILPAAEQYGLSTENLYLDPLVLTVNGMQDQVVQAIMAVDYFKQVAVPSPKTTCGISNVSNSIPAENRPLLNQVFIAMMLGAGLASGIMNALDKDLIWVIRTVESRDTSTPRGRLYVALADAVAAGEEFQVEPSMLENPETWDIAKTINILYNRQIYAHSYLSL